MTTEERAEDYLEHPPKYPGIDSAVPIIEDLLRLYRSEKNRADRLQLKYDSFRQNVGM